MVNNEIHERILSKCKASRNFYDDLKYLEGSISIIFDKNDSLQPNWISGLWLCTKKVEVNWPKNILQGKNWKNYKKRTLKKVVW